jgi:hypothetical protein
MDAVAAAVEVAAAGHTERAELVPLKGDNVVVAQGNTFGDFVEVERKAHHTFSAAPVQKEMPLRPGNSIAGYGRSEDMVAECEWPP